MSNISISQLETIRKNPISYAKSIKDGKVEQKSFGGRPKSVKWLESVLTYHTTSDISKAIDNLEQAFSNRQDTRANLRELEKLINALDNYVDEYTKSGYIFIDKKINMDIPITKTLKITGWIWLIYLKPDTGCAGFIVSKEINEMKWKLELRFPIIQDYLATKLYGYSSKDVDVGLIDFQTGKLYTNSFSEIEISDSLLEFEQIKNKMKKVLK
jgi:hypothetical protein